MYTLWFLSNLYHFACPSLMPYSISTSYCVSLTRLIWNATAIFLLFAHAIVDFPVTHVSFSCFFECHSNMLSSAVLHVIFDYHFICAYSIRNSHHIEMSRSTVAYLIAHHIHPASRPYLITPYLISIPLMSYSISPFVSCIMHHIFQNIQTHNGVAQYTKWCDLFFSDCILVQKFYFQKENSTINANYGIIREPWHLSRSLA